MKRQIIRIDEDKCNGCGNCVPGCPEGALQVIDGKARLVSDLFCDGLGACIGECPERAIEIEEREAEPYDERRVMANIVKQGRNTIMAHLKHLEGHGQTEYLATAREVLKEKGISDPTAAGPEPHPHAHAHGGGCPGSRSFTFGPQSAEPGPRAASAAAGSAGEPAGGPSALTHWPLQLHLMSPRAPQYQGADVLLAADCVAFALGDFHRKLLKGRTLAIACPKLDDGMDIYLEKLRSLVDDARINTLTVATMEVPCCSGLLRLAQEALKQSKRKVPIRSVVVGIRGEVLSDDWA
jgi:Pyruvate/2-oxoacid:ferredoxin oxidoreductase delta subunit